MSVEVCEHGHLRRKCEVCELKAEVVRLREVCSGAAWFALPLVKGIEDRLMRTRVETLIADLTEAGKEPTDGQ